MPRRSLAALILGAVALTASEAPIRLRSPGLEVAIDADSGRILGFAPRGAGELLWRHPDAAAHPVGGWLNIGGDKLWLWPIGSWQAVTGAGWPPPSDRPGQRWTAEERPGAVLLRSPPIAGFDVRLEREIAVSGESGLRIVNRLVTLRPDAARPASALWMVTQLRVPLDLLVGPLRDPSARLDMLGEHRAWLPQPAADGRLSFAVRPAHKAKAGVDADTITAVYADGSLVLHSEAMPGAWRPGERAQVYSEPDGSPDLPAGTPGFVEAEFTAPIGTAEAQELAVTWTWLRR